MAIIEASGVQEYIECCDYFDNDGVNLLSDEELKKVAMKAEEYLYEQLYCNDWFTSLIDACISDALATRN